MVGARISQNCLYNIAINDPDVTQSAWLPVVMNQIAQSFSITTACIPHIKRFMESLESGMIRVEDPHNVGNNVELHPTTRSSPSIHSGKLDTVLVAYARSHYVGKNTLGV